MAHASPAVPLPSAHDPASQHHHAVPFTWTGSIMGGADGAPAGPGPHCTAVGAPGNQPTKWNQTPCPDPGLHDGLATAPGWSAMDVSHTRVQAGVRHTGRVCFIGGWFGGGRVGSASKGGGSPGCRPLFPEPAPHRQPQPTPPAAAGPSSGCSAGVFRPNMGTTARHSHTGRATRIRPSCGPAPQRDTRVGRRARQPPQRITQTRRGSPRHRRWPRPLPAPPSRPHRRRRSGCSSSSSPPALRHARQCHRIEPKPTWGRPTDVRAGGGGGMQVLHMGVLTKFFSPLEKPPLVVS